MRHELVSAITLTKKDIVDRISQESDVTKARARTIVQLVLDSVVDHVIDGGRVEFRDHFVIECREHAERTMRNPKTGERVVVPKRRVVRFRPGRRIREAFAPRNRRCVQVAPLRNGNAATSLRLARDDAQGLTVVNGAASHAQPEICAL